MIRKNTLKLPHYETNDDNMRQYIGCVKTSLHAN